MCASGVRARHSWKPAKTRGREQPPARAATIAITTVIEGKGGGEEGEGEGGTALAVVVVVVVAAAAEAVVARDVVLF